jgi:hypothetical protein
MLLEYLWIYLYYSFLFTRKKKYLEINRKNRTEPHGKQFFFFANKSFADSVNECVYGDKLSIKAKTGKGILKRKMQCLTIEQYHTL